MVVTCKCNHSFDIAYIYIFYLTWPIKYFLFGIFLIKVNIVSNCSLYIILKKDLEFYG